MQYVRKFGSLALLALCCANAAGATDYYVAADGKDSHKGTSPAAPWKTIKKVNQHPFVPGDRVHFRGGDQFQGMVYVHDFEGSASQPLTFTSYGGTRAMIEGEDTPGFFVYNSSGVVIQEIDVAGSGVIGSTDDGISVYTDLPGDVRLGPIAIDRVEVSGFAGHGIAIGGDNGRSGFRDVALTHIDAHHNGDTGIFVWGNSEAWWGQTPDDYPNQEVRVARCKAYSNVGSGIIVSGCATAVVELNTAWGNGVGNLPTQGPVGIWTYDSRDVTIQMNESFDNWSNGTDGGGFDIDGGSVSCVLQYNYSHGNKGAGFLVAQYPGARPMQDVTVRYNISEGDAIDPGAGSLMVWNGSTSTPQDVYFHDNTVYTVKVASSAAAVREIGAGPQFKNLRFWNNVLYAKGGAILVDAKAGGGLRYQGNLYHSQSGLFVIKQGTNVYGSLTAWRAAGQEQVGGAPVGVQADPQFVNAAGGAASGYQLQPTSPARDAGLGLSQLFGVAPGTFDYFGNLLQDWVDYDIGCHEL